MLRLVNTRTLGFTGLLLLWAAAAPAQNVQTVRCRNNVPLRGMYADVTVANGVSCTLDGALVFGSVLVSGRGTLTAKNGTEVRGSVQVNSGGNITLAATNVLGGVILDQSGNLSVKSGSTLANISMKKSGYLTIENSAVTDVLSTESGNVTVTNARIFPGGVTMKLSNGSLTLCGSEIGFNSETEQEGSGGVSMLETTGNLLADAGFCDPSGIQGSVVVEKGTGNVRLVGAALNGDLAVIEQTGDVVVDGSTCNGCATVGDVKVEKGKSGDITLKAVRTDSDATISENNGNVTIESSSLGSDVSISRNKKVVVKKNSFSLEDVHISGNGGPIEIDSNCDMRLTVNENSGAVTISNNNVPDAQNAGVTCTSGFGFSDADVTKNTGGVSIKYNTGEGLFCSDNNPAPTVSGNTITFAGQCDDD